MKKLFRELFFALMRFLISLRLGWYKLLNMNKLNIFVYTDSRGSAVGSIFNKNNPFSLYVKYFIKNYNADVFLCPEKSTTVFDFLYEFKKQDNNYTFVIAHIGVVDFAPRPITQNISILKSKKFKIINLFGEKMYNKLLSFEGYEQKYNGEITSSTVPEFMLPFIAEKFNEIDNLIWISCNKVLADWVGNYKERPKNSNLIIDKSILFSKHLKTEKVVDLTNWLDEEIKNFTCDNVHLTNDGSEFILEDLKNIIRTNYKNGKRVY